MTNTKRELLNDVLTGILVAATFAAAMPVDVWAQSSGAAAAGTGDLSSVVSNTSGAVFAPAMTMLSYLSYAIGAVMVIAGIAGAKKHADNPGSNPLGPALGKLGAGGAFLSAPYVIATIQGAGSSTFGSSGGTIVTTPLSGF